jgi:dipeptidase E
MPLIHLRGENMIDNGIKRVLLVSNSTLYGSSYLDHAESEIRDFLGNVGRVLFVPYALYDRDAYASTARERYRAMGYDMESVHEASDPRRAVNEAEAIFIGGGNTFRLLKSLYDFDLLDSVRLRVEGGMPYIGSSAGSNVAGPTIRTTKDMPIVQPPSFDALGLVSFQISPHYLDPDPNSMHMGETQEQRILQFLEENDTTVFGLREGAMVRVERGSTVLKGSSGARIFRKGYAPAETLPGENLNQFISPNTPEVRQMEEITATELKQRLDGGEDLQIIDVREPDEYEIARLENSKLIPLGQIVNRMDEIDPARETVVHCQGGKRSAKAIEALQRAGFAGRLVNLKGGITAWSDEVDPSVPKY